jgi:hypothetical protein
VDSPQGDYWTATLSLLRNAFFRALKSGFQKDAAVAP